MKQDDPPDHPTKKMMPLVKTVVAGLVVLLFCILNIFVLRNAASLIPSERTQRLIRFRLTPEFWPDWYAHVLWTLAVGVTLSSFLRLRIVQNGFTFGARMPFWSWLRLPVFEPKWFQKLKEYPLERYLITAIPAWAKAIGSCFRPKYFQHWALFCSVLYAVCIVLIGLGQWAKLLSFLQQTAIWLLLVPFWFARTFINLPLRELSQNGAMTWQMAVGATVSFAFVMATYLYAKKIIRLPRRNKTLRWSARYTVLGAIIYAILLVSTGQLSIGPSRWDIFAYYEKFYHEYLSPLFYLLWHKPLFTRELLVAYLLLSAGAYLYACRIRRTPGRWKKLKKTFRYLKLPLLFLFILTYDTFFAVCWAIFRSLFRFTIRSLQDGTLSWWQIISYGLAVMIFFGLCFYSRRIRYSSDRRTELWKAFRILGIPFLALLLLCGNSLLHAVSLLPSLMTNTVGLVLWLPSYMRWCLYYELCRFIFYGGLYKELVTGFAVAFFAHVGFMQILRQSRYSPLIIYLCLWSVFIATCLAKMIWMIVLIIAPVVWLYWRLMYKRDVAKLFSFHYREWFRKAETFFLSVFMTSILFWCLVLVYPQYFPIKEWLKTIDKFFMFNYSYPLMELFISGTLSWKAGLSLAVLAVILLTALRVWIRRHVPPKIKERRTTNSFLQFILLASVNLAVVMMNMLCLAHVWGSGANLQLFDIRFWPWWLMIVPLSLVIFAGSGLAALRKWKPPVLPLLLLFSLFGISNSVQAEPSTITLLEPAKFVSVQEAREARKNESKPGQGGFLAEQTMLSRKPNGNFPNERRRRWPFADSVQELKPKKFGHRLEFEIRFEKDGVEHTYSSNWKTAALYMDVVKRIRFSNNT